MLQLHPDNPHYFLWRGRPTVIIGSGEHYGAVLHRAFDYVKYLDTLQSYGLNHTRLFTGTYVEPEEYWAGDVILTGNTLGPGEGEMICPYARSDQPGYAGGGNKFDLSRWDESYLARLADFVSQASQRGVIVEVNLFCPYYRDEYWHLAPWHVANNVNNLPYCDRMDVYTLDRSGPLLALQEAVVRRIVQELRGFDNVYYEICNEPYFGGVTLPWQHHIGKVIADAEAGFPARHLISQNIANYSARVVDPAPTVSIYNFHYAWPPDTVAQNWPLNRPIGDNETGFRGPGDRPYRREGWEFILAGGALFSHLDFSFTVGHEDGSYPLRPDQVGGGSRTLREQLATLKRFIEGFDVTRMVPDNAAIRGGTIGAALDGGMTQISARALVEPGAQYAIYVAGGDALRLGVLLPPGHYAAEWLDPLSGNATPAGVFHHAGGEYILEAPPYAYDIALGIRKAIE